MSPLAISLRFLQTQPDGRLVELARAGHERAFEALVRRYRGPLLAYCRRVAPSGTAADDILQQGLLQAWKALSGGAEVREARAWLYRIVHNVAISALRASGELPDGMMAAPGAPSVDQLVEQRMAARDALAGLAALPDLQRQVMVSTALDGQSHEETAAALGLTSGSVRGLIYRARSTLRAAAAAVVPAPVIEWALGDAGGSSVGLAGAGSAGLGALVLKGGAVLAVGAVAGTTAIVIDHRPHRAQPAAKAAIASARDAADSNGAPGHGPVSADHGDAAIVLAAARGLGGTGPASGHHTEIRVDGGGRHDGGSDGSRPSGSHGGDGGGDGSPSGGDGSPGGTGGSDGSTGGSGGSSGGSDGGGDPGATVATPTGSDDGDHGSGGLTSLSGSHDGGGSGSSGSDGGGPSGSSDGGGSGGSDGGTATTTTTITSTTSGH